MKKLILILAIGIGLSSCNGPGYYPPQQQYQVMTGPGGQQQVMFNDNGVQQMMDYALFMSLMNNGGYSNVIHSYRQPIYHVHVYDNSYSSWNRSAPSRVDGTANNRAQGSYGSGQTKSAPINTTSNTSTKGGWSSTSTNKAPVSASNSGWKSSSTGSSNSGWKSSSSSSSSSRSSSYGGRRK